MAEIKDVHGIVEDLKEQRDRLRVRVHLAKAEVKDEWEALEKRWEHVRGKLALVGDEAGAAAHEVGAALQLAAEEIQRGYERITRLL
jgi:hypothetical protein